MKRVSLLTLAVLLIGTLFSTQVMAQGRINLNAAKTTQECRNVKIDGFSASFSYSSIESQDVNTERGVFSVLNMGNSIAAGNIGDPQVLVTRELIAVPFGATPVVNVKSYTVEEYNLADFGINRLYPQQPSQSKSEKDVKFAYNEAAYAAKGFDESRPIAEVTVMGTMRGIQIGALQLNTLRYNASSNTIRVYNNVEVEVSFENADLELTEKTLVNTYSPYFRTAYSALFNNRAILDIYDDHPDLWAVPVKVLVVANRMFEDAMQPWLTWKTEKGFYMDVNYTDEIGTSASSIKTFIHNKYNEGVAEGQAPSFLIIVGDNGQVPASQTGSASHCVTDLYYYSTDNDVFGDMYHSRFTCETVAEFEIVRDKSLMYEQYTMPDPSYLSNTLLIAGWDATWNPKDGKPTIQYAMNYYYNAEHGFNTVYNWLEQPYTGCYEPMNTGVNFVNYTAHGSNTSWADPSFTNSNVNSLTNQDKYFWAMGNCCQAADWGISGKCLGETFIIAPNKGAFAYIGSCPSSYWYEDYYFAVGATNTFYAPPTYEESSMGCYDSHFQDDFNSISAVPFVGNLAVAYSHANGYQGSVSDQYYWESYHVLGDGSICPYHVNPIENTVSHMPTLPIGMDFYTVSADPGSYVGISKDGILYGAGEIGEDGTADIPITPITSGGNVKIVVTHPQRQPYVAEVPAAAMTGAYVAVDSYALNVDQANYGETIDMDITLKNVGTLASGAITATLTTDCEYVEILNAEGNLAALNPDQLGTINGFQFAVAENVPDKTKAQFVLEVTDGTDTWNATINITLHAPVVVFESTEQVQGQSGSHVNFKFKNNGTAPFYGGVLSITSCSPDLVFDPETITVDDVVEGGQELTITVNYSVDESVELGTTFEVAYDFVTGLFEISDIFVVNHGDIMEDFESGSFSGDWSFNPVNAWTIVDGGTKGKCAKSMNEGLHGTDYSATLTVNVLAAGELTFKYYVSSESNYDKLFFYMDNQQMGQWSGSVNWTEFVQPVTVGQHTFKWEYHKDGSVNSGDDCAKIDEIKFPPTNVITFITPAADLTYEVSAHNVTLNWTASADAESYLVKRDTETVGTTTETTFTDEVEESGIYKYSVYAVNASGSMSAPVSVLVEFDFTGVTENQNANISVYPNPASDVLTINTNNNFKYQLVNSLGQVVRSGNATNKAIVRVGDLNKGIYFLTINAGNQVSVQKVVVE
jgi:gingipain K